MRDGDFFTSIGEGRTIALLLALKDAPAPLILKDLLPIMNHTQTLRSRIDRMQSEGLVNVDVILEAHKKVAVSLTDLGKEAALLSPWRICPSHPGRN